MNIRREMRPKRAMIYLGVPKFGSFVPMEYSYTM